MSEKDNLFLYTDITPDTPDDADMTQDNVADEPVIVVDDTAPTEAPEAAETAQPSVEETAVADEPTESDALEEEFRSPDGDAEIVVPSFSGTADALTAAPKAKPAPIEEPAAPTATPPADTKVEEPAAPEAPLKRHPLMRVLGELVPHIGDQMFDIVRKTVMIIGIIAFITAGVAFVTISFVEPIQYEQKMESLRHQYDPDGTLELTEDEQNYKYPEGMDPSFKKLYYQNSDVRGWITYNTTDKSTFNIDYPIVQSADNDYYLFHDFNGTYNKNGVLFFDYRNQLSSPNATNRNTIIYGHNMASGQMFAGLNKLLWGVDTARLAPTFTMNTIYEKAEYKVFAVMLVNNTSTEGIPFGYLRTEFNDNVDFASFLSEILARSLYIYGDVDVRPDDEIVTLSTCTDNDLAHFTDGRTVVVARKVREGENPATDVSQISYNADVIMPYAWYENQKQQPHPYYTNQGYVIQPLDSLMDYLATSTAPEGATTTTFTLYTDANGTFGLISSLNTTVMTNINGQPITGQPQPIGLAVDSTPINYYVGSSFDYARTKVTLLLSDGTKQPLDSMLCAVTGFNSSKAGECKVTMHYGSLNATFNVNFFDLPTDPSEDEVVTTTTTKVATTTTKTPTPTTMSTTAPTTPTSSTTKNPNINFPDRTSATTSTTLTTTVETTDPTETEVPAP